MVVHEGTFDYLYSPSKTKKQVLSKQAYFMILHYCCAVQSVMVTLLLCRSLD
jgi:hypothetical protein